MTDSDLPQFTVLLDSVCAMLSRGQYTPNDTSTGIFFRALAKYPMDAVRAAFAEHVDNSRFVPVPADISDRLRENDGRPDAEEAWAIALTGRDENVTIVWTDEMAEAWGIARHVLPDKVGARMAFKETYARLVDEARANRVPTTWHAAEGHEAAERHRAIARAADLGRVVAGYEPAQALPAPRAAAVLLLPAPEGTTDTAPEGAREALAAACARLVSRPEPVSIDVAERERTAELQRQTVERVARYGLAHGIKTTAPATPAPQQQDQPA